MTAATLTSSSHSPTVLWAWSPHVTTLSYVDRPPSLPSPMPQWEEAAIARLAALERLTPNWDTYGGYPVTRTHSTRAAKFLRSVMAAEAPVPDIVPLADGGLQLEWYLGWGRFDFITDSDAETPTLLIQENGQAVREIVWAGVSAQISLVRSLLSGDVPA